MGYIMSNCNVGLRLRVMALIFLFFIHFSFFRYNMLTSKICAGLFSGTFKVRMLKLCIYMDNKLLYCGIENQTPCSYSSLYMSILLSFQAKFGSQFSQVGIHMSDCIVGLRLRIMALILLFFVHFFSFPILHVKGKKIVSEFSQKLLKLES